MKKTGFTLIELLVTIIILGVLSLITIPTVLNLIHSSKERAYNEQINSMLNISKKYATMNDLGYEDNIPKILTFDMLKQEGLIKDSEVINPMTSKPLKGCIFYTWMSVDNQYHFEYSENCIDKNSLIYKLKQQYNEVNVVGLLKDEKDNYYYKGTNEEVANNFVWYEGHLWRVIQINNDNTITMITQQPITNIHPTKVWTTMEEYKNSYFNSWLNNIFYNSISDKSKIEKTLFNVGIYTDVSEITTTEYVGLLDEIQYTRAGLENSFLDIKDYFYLGNRYSEEYLRHINKIGGLDYDGYQIALNLDTSLGIRPVIRISNIITTIGSGTISNPFRENNKATNTSNVKVGEYISVPGSSSYCGNDARCLFRVVSKDSDSVKVILNGLLPTVSQFNGASYDVIFKESSPVNKPLTEFVNSIDTNYRYKGNKLFNIGLYSDGNNYTSVTSNTYSGNVGLPVIGELFSANDIDQSNPVTDPKIFVNIDTIENVTADNGFWLMNGNNVWKDTYYAQNTFADGITYSGYASHTAGIRPVMFLNFGTNLDLTFTKGDGTAENPYWLGN